jgi:hypothetical protein
MRVETGFNGYFPPESLFETSDNPKSAIKSALEEERERKKTHSFAKQFARVFPNVCCSV